MWLRCGNSTINHCAADAASLKLISAHNPVIMETRWITFTLCRLGGVISAYKIVPDEIDEIKVCLDLSRSKLLENVSSLRN